MKPIHLHLLDWSPQSLTIEANWDSQTPMPKPGDFIYCEGPTGQPFYLVIDQLQTVSNQSSLRLHTTPVRGYPDFPVHHATLMNSQDYLASQLSVDEQAPCITLGALTLNPSQLGDWLFVDMKAQHLLPELIQADIEQNKTVLCLGSALSKSVNSLSEITDITIGSDVWVSLNHIRSDRFVEALVRDLPGTLQADCSRFLHEQLASLPDSGTLQDILDSEDWRTFSYSRPLKEKLTELLPYFDSPRSGSGKKARRKALTLNPASVYRFVMPELPDDLQQILYIGALTPLRSLTTGLTARIMLFQPELAEQSVRHFLGVTGHPVTLVSRQREPWLQLVDDAIFASSEAQNALVLQGHVTGGVTIPLETAMVTTPSTLQAIGGSQPVSHAVPNLESIPSLENPFEALPETDNTPHYDNDMALLSAHHQDLMAMEEEAVIDDWSLQGLVGAETISLDAPSETHDTHHLHPEDVLNSLISEVGSQEDDSDFDDFSAFSAPDPDTAESLTEEAAIELGETKADETTPLSLESLSQAPIETDFGSDFDSFDLGPLVMDAQLNPSKESFTSPAEAFDIVMPSGAGTASETSNDIPLSLTDMTFENEAHPDMSLEPFTLWDESVNSTPHTESYQAPEQTEQPVEQWLEAVEAGPVKAPLEASLDWNDTALALPSEDPQAEAPQAILSKEGLGSLDDMTFLDTTGTSDLNQLGGDLNIAGLTLDEAFDTSFEMPGIADITTDQGFALDNGPLVADEAPPLSLEDTLSITANSDWAVSSPVELKGEGRQENDRDLSSLLSQVEASGDIPVDSILQPAPAEDSLGELSDLGALSSLGDFGDFSEPLGADMVNDSETEEFITPIWGDALDDIQDENSPSMDTSSPMSMAAQSDDDDFDLGINLDILDSNWDDLAETVATADAPDSLAAAASLPVVNNNPKAKSPSAEAYQVGQQVTHPSYGQGRIQKVMQMYDDQVVLNILFEGVGKRLLDPSLCDLKTLSTAN